MSKFYIGPAGWTYDDWVGAVFPSEPSRRFDPLAFIAERFNAIEINTSFYHIPPVKNVASWCRRVAFREDFLFTVKLWKGFTHERQWTEKDLAQMLAVLDRFAEAQRLGCVLLQFPWSFRQNQHHLEFLREVIALFKSFPLAVEVRHNNWYRSDYVDFLKASRVAFVNVDQPLVSENLALTREATASFAYLRLHGRNADHWFNEESGPNDRYNYLYSPREQRDIVDVAQELGKRAQKVFLIANNHFRGQAVANAAELQSELTGVMPPLPPSLTELYPQILRFGAPPESQSRDEGEQLSLF